MSATIPTFEPGQLARVLKCAAAGDHAGEAGLVTFVGADYVAIRMWDRVERRFAPSILSPVGLELLPLWLHNWHALQLRAGVNVDSVSELEAQLAEAEASADALQATVEAVREWAEGDAAEGPGPLFYAGYASAQEWVQSILAAAPTPRWTSEPPKEDE